MTDMEAALNAYEPPVRRPSDTVTMNRPLAPWDGVCAFHRYLALHIHGATRIAGHGAKNSNEGMARDDEDDAKRFDLIAGRNVPEPAE
jgi:hypothetical protein